MRLESAHRARIRFHPVRLVTASRRISMYSSASIWCSAGVPSASKSANSLSLGWTVRLLEDATVRFTRVREHLALVEIYVQKPLSRSRRSKPDGFALALVKDMGRLVDDEVGEAAALVEIPEGDVAGRLLAEPDDPASVLGEKRRTDAVEVEIGQGPRGADLIVEQDVLGLPLDDAPDVVHEFSAGAIAVLLDPLQDVQATARSERRTKKVAEGIEVVRCENGRPGDEIVELRVEQRIV